MSLRGRYRSGVFFFISKGINRINNILYAMPRRSVEITTWQAEELDKPENQDINFAGLCRKALDEELTRRRMVKNHVQ